MTNATMRLAMALQAVKHNEKISTILKNTDPNLLAQIDDALAAFEAETDAYQKRMKAAFDLVCDKTDWKAPIYARVPLDANLAEIKEAVEHFTATTPVFQRLATYIKVTADGYRKGPAGDK